MMLYVFVLCIASIRSGLVGAYVPDAFNTLNFASHFGDCYAFSVNTNTLSARIHNVIQPSVGGFVCEDNRGRFTYGELGMTLGGCFSHIGKKVLLVNGVFRFPIVDFSADVCTVLSMGYGKVVTTMAKAMVKSAAKNFVKKAGPWAQRKAATAGMYSKALKSGQYGKKGEYLWQVNQKLYDSAIKQVAKPALPPHGDCMAMFNALKSQQDRYFCLIRKAADATGHYYLRDAVNGIEKFQRSLMEGLKYMKLEALLPSSNIGVRLDLALDVNNMGVSLYFGFNIEMAIFNHGRAAAAIASALGQACSQVSRQVCRKVTIKGWDWLGRAINSGVKWVCDNVIDTVCRAFEVTAEVCNRVGDLIDWMPKLKYSYSNLKIAGPVTIGDVLEFVRMPSMRDLEEAGVKRRRMMGNETSETEADMLNMLKEKLSGGLEAPEKTEIHDDDLPVDDEDMEFEFEGVMDVPDEIDFDEEEHFMCAEHGTEAECSRMRVCVWSHHGCVAEFEEDEKINSDNEDAEVIEKDVKSLGDAEKNWRSHESCKSVSQRTFNRKMKKVGRALKLANCDLELTFKGGAGDVWENEMYEEVGATSERGDIPREAVTLLDAVLDLTAKKGLRGSAKCRRLSKLAEKMNREDGLFEIRVGKEVENGERRRIEGEEGAEILDARLYDCIVRWESLSDEHQNRCKDRANQLGF